MRDITPDPEKATSLVKMAETIRERIDDTDNQKYCSQIVKDYYEAIHALMEALAAKNGKKSQGKGAHAKLIRWIADEVELKKHEQDLLDKLRKHRNRITYEGFTIQPDFLFRNENDIRGLYTTIKKNI